MNERTKAAIESLGTNTVLYRTFRQLFVSHTRLTQTNVYLNLNQDKVDTDGIRAIGAALKVNQVRATIS